MNNQIVSLWGRDLTLEIVYDCYQGETPNANQKRALKEILCQWTEVENSKAAVENYCKDADRDQIGSEETFNIFKYVVPQAIFLKRTNDNNRTVAILCAYRLDQDNGLAIVFKNEKLYQVGTQNIIL